MNVVMDKTSGLYKRYPLSILEVYVHTMRGNVSCFVIKKINDGGGVLFQSDPRIDFPDSDNYVCIFLCYSLYISV